MKLTMKKRNVRKSDSGIKFIHIFLILVFVAGITFLCLSLFVPQKNKTEEPSLNTAVNETEKKNNENKKNEEKDNKEKENPNNTPAQYEGEKPTSDTKINASLTKNEVINGTYMLRIEIYELLSEGTCKLHMESDKGDSLDRTAKIATFGPDSSTCEEGFDIPTNGISSGKYNFTITLTSGSKTGSVSGTINI